MGLERFVANAIHDLRWELGRVRELIALLRDGLAGLDCEEDLDDMVSNLQLSEILLSDLSALSGELSHCSERSEPISKPGATDIFRIAHEVYSMMKRKYLGRVDAVWKPGSGVFEIEADEGQLMQVFMNLYMNASEAMPDGGKLTIQTEKEDEFVCVRVADTGCGIAPENQRRLFRERFTTKTQGSGMGLHAIVGPIVRAHGGSIDVESEEGKGTTFILRLPVKLSKRAFTGSVRITIAHTGAHQITAHPTSAEAYTPKAGKERDFNVLVVDDDEDVGFLFERVLGGPEEVTRVTDGFAAIETTREIDYDLVFLDVRLPGIDGVETLRRLKEISPDAVVIMMSGHEVSQEIKEALQLGAQDFIPKPFHDLSDIMIIEQVARYLSLHGLTVTQLARGAELPAFTVGRQWHAKRELLDRWIEREASRFLER